MICKTAVCINIWNRFNIHVSFYNVFLQINPGIDTVCKFYVTRGVEEDKYKPSKLPAPGRQRAIRMKSNDVALIMYRNSESKWSEHTYLSGNDVSRLEMPAGAWIVIANEDGTLRQYRYYFLYCVLCYKKKWY